MFGERLARVFLGISLVKRTSGHGPPSQKTRAQEGIAQIPSSHSPKLKIVQSMLHSFVGDSASDSTIIFSRTLPTRLGDRSLDAEVEEKIAKLPALVLQGQSLGALALCHDIEAAFARAKAADAMPENILDLRRCLEQELLEPRIELVAPDLRLCPISARSALIGRPAAQSNADIAINCRWFSRADKSLQLSAEGADWFIEDLGSANGSYIGEKRLQRGERFSLPEGQTTVEIGRSFDRRSPVIVHLSRCPDDTVVIAVSVGAAFDKAGWQSWPSLQEDLSKRWVVFRDDFLLGAGSTSKLLGIDAPQAAAAISLRNGYWIAPRTQSPVRLDGIDFHCAVPLAAESELEVGPLKFQIRRLSDDPSASGGDASAASAGIQA